MSSIRLQGVTKFFGDKQVVYPFNLEIEHGEFITFVGPSGCGKSTLLRLIAGLEEVSSGSVSIAGEDITAKRPSQRGLAMVFQSYALYPHMTVRKNIGFPLKMAGVDQEQANRKIEEAAAILNLTDYLEYRPKQLSGGQRQRVAIGRAIVREPKAFLFDEPLSNLDAALRINMRFEIIELHRQLRNTMIYVTHDQVEAMTMSSRLVVLRDGRIEQVGKPLELYDSPRNRFVAGFLGSPQINFIEGPVAQEYDAACIGVRPEHFQLTDAGAPWNGTVGVSEHLGSDTFIRIESEQLGRVLLRVSGETPVTFGERIGLQPTGVIHRFDREGRAL